MIHPGRHSAFAAVALAAAVGLACPWSVSLLGASPPAMPAPPTPVYQDLQYRTDTWYGSTFWTGPNWTRVGKDWHHPGEQTPAVRAFFAPKDGRVSVSGRVYKADPNGGDGVHLEIRHNDRVVWQQNITAADTKGVEPKLTLDLRKGDALRFVVAKGGTIFFDTTHWDPLVAYEGGAAYQASAAFAAIKQGEGGWRYEMQLPPGVTAIAVPPPPKAHTPYPFAGGDLAAMVEAEWRWEDQLDGSAGAYLAAARKHLPQAQALLADLRRQHGAGFLKEQAQRLEGIAKQITKGPSAVQAAERVYLDLRRLTREIALANPLMDFGKLLLVKRVPTSYSHLVMQYFGWRARSGGGLFVLDSPGRSLACRDILAGKLAGGNVLEPRLSYDARRIVFSYVACPPKPPAVPQTLNESAPDENYYHVWEVNVDGTGLHQLTAGPYDDLMPEYLPDGGIVFTSTRRRGYARCFGGQFGQRWHVYTLHRMDGDGSDLRELSYHDTNEWFPRVGNDGLIYYARWDYIDRDAVTHQTLWSTRPDGTNPMSVWGNATPKPHCTFQAQPVPGRTKFVFTASAHHSITGGCLTLLDTSLGDNGPEPLLRLTPDIPFPEAEPRGGVGYYCAPWPLSEKYFLVSYSPLELVFEPRPNPANALGIYLLDAWGNRELLYRDVAIGCEDACPLRPRPTPPDVHTDLPPGAPAAGEVVLQDVYQGLGGAAAGTIQAIRIVQIFPKTTNVANAPPIGLAGEENARAILGTVPVEPDGSAHFTVPARTPLLFQALDRDGNAYQTMRSLTYLQPGERVSCVGCHERRPTAPPGRPARAALRPPSTIQPGELGGQPFSYARFVQPVLDRHCVRCHGGPKDPAKPADAANVLLGGNMDFRGLSDPKHPFYSRSYVALMTKAGLVPRFPARNQVQLTPPGGQSGALGSKLMKILRSGRYKLTDAELRAVAAWIDCNAIFYGVNLPADQARQFKGERIDMPAIQ